MKATIVLFKNVFLLFPFSFREKKAPKSVAFDCVRAAVAAGLRMESVLPADDVVSAIAMSDFR